MKNKVSTYVVFIVLAIIAVYSCFSRSIFKQIMIVLISLIGAIAVIMQLKASADISRAEFIINLQEVYTSNDGFINLFEKCWENYLGEITPQELENYLKENKEALVSYLTFFESLYLMLNQGVLKMSIVDDLFGRRFFIVVNNRTVQKFDLAKNYKYYLNVVDLHKDWTKYRVKIAEKKCSDNQQALVAIKEDLFICFSENHSGYCNLQEAVLGKEI